MGLTPELKGCENFYIFRILALAIFLCQMGRQVFNGLRDAKRTKAIILH
jgi:hypothetical protein